MENRRKLLTTGIWLPAILLTGIALWRSLWISLDIDEGYALTMSYRLAVGDRLLADLWEPHQFSAVFAVPFIALYRLLTGGNTGLVVYLRVLGILIHALVGYAFISVFRGKASRPALGILYLLHLCFLPKWVQSPEMELQQYWFLMLDFSVLYRALFGQTRRRILLLALGGLFLLCQMLCYPSLGLLYPVCALLIFFLSGKKWRDVLSFTLGALIPGLALTGILFSYQTPPEFISHLKRMNSDLSHSLPLMQRLLDHAKEFLPMLVLALVLCLGTALGSKALAKRGFLQGDRQQAMQILTAGIILILSAVHFFGLLLGDVSQFFFLWRYFLMACLGIVSVWICGRSGKGEEKGEGEKVLLLGILPALAASFGILILTNMDVNTTFAKVFPAALFTMAILLLQRPEGLASRITTAAALCLLASLLLCRIGFIRVTGCVRTPLFTDLETIKDGPAKGVRMLPELAEALNDDYEVLTSLLEEEDRLLYIGNESWIYTWTEAGISGASTQGTTVFNNLYIDYLNEHPDRYPTVVVVDKELDRYPYYYNSEWNVILLDWIQTWFPYTETIETEFMTVYLAR